MKGSIRGICIAAFSLILLSGIFSGFASGATFCSFGSGAGQCERPQGLAVEQSSGNVYLVDGGNSRVDTFSPGAAFISAFGWGVADGTTNALQNCTSPCFRGIAGGGPGQLAFARGIAIDNEPLSPANGNVYVVDANGVQRFSGAGAFVLEFPNGQIDDGGPIAALGGSVYLGDMTESGGPLKTTIKQFSPVGSVTGSSTLPGTGFTSSLALDSAGDAYIVRNNNIEKFELSEPNATLLNAFGAGASTTSVALDGANNLYAAQLEEGTRVITKYDPSGVAVSRFGYGEIGFQLEGLAVSAAGDALYGSEAYVGSETIGNRVLSIPFPDPGPLSCCLEANPLSNTKATLKAKINPENKETTFHFDYVDQASFEASGFTNAKSTAETTVGSDLTLHPVSVPIGCPVPQVPPQASCLKPETTYRYRLVATNADAPAGVISEGTPFKTLPPLEIKDTFATEVGPDAAQLHAVVNPLGIPATGYFEYVDDAGFQVSGFGGATQIPNVAGGAAPIDLGSAEADKSAIASIAGLSPDTTYHFRFVALDSFTPPGGLAGPERTLHTVPIPGGANVNCQNQAFRVGPSANLPDCRAYEMVSPVQKGNADIAVRLSGLNFPAGLDQSSDSGDQISYSSEKSFGDAVSAPYTSQYLATRSEGVGWSSHGISAPRESKSFSENASTKFDLEYKDFSPDLSAGWFLHDSPPLLNECAAPGFLNLYRRDLASGAYEALTTAKPINETAPQYWPELQGLSADGTHAVFRANGKLTKDAASTIGSQGAIYQLYEHVAGPGCGELRLVSVLPNGKAATQASAAGNGNSPTAEGRANNVIGAISRDGTRIFWSTASAGVPGALYVRIEGKETIQISPAPTSFRAADPDGSRVIYQRSGDVYEYDLASKTETLMGVDAGTAALSEDATQVYFVSEQALGGKGTAGKQNLYLHESGGGTPVFIGTLSDEDVAVDEHLPTAVVGIPSQRGTRTTPDGRHFAFVSSASLTGYDNRDSDGGKPNVELFLYDADGGELSCISCLPSGARPAGRTSGLFSRKVSALLPAWENQFFAPRALSEDGNHLFFNSFVPLVPRDSNGAADAYEWERAASAKECAELGAELYVASAGGCLSLISTGKSSADSEVIDASPDGSDVFIKTSSSLVPQDPGLVDIYDVREGGGFPPPAPPNPACEGEACQSPGQPPSNTTPSSANFQGPENVKEKPKCKKGKVRKGGKCVKKKAKKKKAAKKRAANNRGAGR